MKHLESPVRVSRRALLGGGVASLAASSLAAASDSRLPADPMSLGKGPHLFIDDFLIASQSNLSRVVVPPVRLPQPVVTGPEDKCFQPYLTVLRDPATKRFRIWYGVPESAMQSHVGYMESMDGIKWIRPHRVLKDPGHIQFGVSILDQGPERDLQRRYTYGWHANGGLMIATSQDGLDWKLLSADPVLRHDHDINNIFWDPIRKRFGANVSTYTTDPSWTGKRRIPMQSYSTDLVRWEAPHRIIVPDSRDEGETQFYCMGGVIARGDLPIGMVRVLRDDLPSEPGGPVAGLGYTTLAWSRDGVNWTRDHTPFMDRNPMPGTWDRAMTWADCQILVGDETWIYYGGYARGHKVDRFTERQIGLARMHLDRYVARRAGPQGGTLRTPIAQFGGSSLTVNARIKGELRVAVWDAAGKPVPGFTAGQCMPASGDGVSIPVRWKGNPAGIPSGRAVQMEFAVKDGDLFGFSVS